MTDNVIPLGNVTSLDLPADRVLEQAMGQGLEGVVLLGFDGDGDFYVKSSYADGGTVLWLMEMAKKKLLEIEQ